MGIPLIDPDDWDDWIQHQEDDQSTIEDLCREFDLACLNQGSTNYCWVNAPTHCAEIVRLQQTGQVYSYSPASCGAPIKNFRNIGGWGSQALARMKVHGINESKDWPDNAISRRHFTDENKAKAKANIVLEWYVLNSWEERVSCILQGFPTADGYNWWRHEVTGVGIAKRSHDLRIRNSWGMGWGNDGFAWLKGSRKHANDSVALRVIKYL